MAIAQPFRVSSKSFIRDATFFTVAAGFSLIFLADGHLALWESAAMVAFYFVYVATVLLWHSMAHTRRRQRARQAHAREHFNSADLLPQDHSRGLSSSSDVDLNGVPTFQSLDQVPQYSSSQEEAEYINGFNADPDNEDDRRRFFAEMSQEIRGTHRRTLSRMTSSGRSIRPSLLGAMEFGSVLASLKQSGNKSQSRLLVRRHSHDNADLLSSFLDPTIDNRSASTRERSLTDTNSEAWTYRDNSAIFLGPGYRIRSASANVEGFLRSDIQPEQNFGFLSQPDNQYTNLSIPPSNSVAASAHGDGDHSPVPTIMLNDSTVLPLSPPLQFDTTSTQPFPPYRDEPLRMASPRKEDPHQKMHRNPVKHLQNRHSRQI